MGKNLVFSIMSVVLLTGCSDIFGCKDRTAVYELVPGDPFFTIQADLLDRARATGWQCTSEGIRNAAGQKIGDRYTCTKCD